MDLDLPELEETSPMDLPPPVPEYMEDIPEYMENTETYMMPEPEEEDALAIFTRQWKAELDTKLSAEFEHEKIARGKAAEDHEIWVTQREIRLTAKKESNRSEEQIFLETLESEAELLKTWDRVSKLIDGGVEASELKKGSDTARMHKLFIQLKNEPLEQTRLEAASVQA